MGSNGIEGAASSVVSAIPTETVKPVFGSANVSSNGLAVLIALIEADSPPIVGSSGFSLSVNGAGRGIAGSSVLGTTITLTPASAVLQGDVVAVSYALGNVTDSNLPTPNALDAFSSQSASNGSTVLPSAPTALSATAQNGAWGVALSWTASSTPNVTYSVYRGITSGGQASTPGASGLTVTSYSDARLSADTAYSYTVKAVRNNVSSVASGEATARTAPAVSANLSVVSGNGQIVLSWTACSGATGYLVSRGTQDGGPYSPIATPTGTGFTDSGPANGTTYFYINWRFFIDATLEFP